MEQLGLSLWNFLAQIVVFLVVVFILAKWALPLVTKFLDERANVIQRGLEDAETAKRQLNEAEKRVAEMIEQARLDGQQALSRATQAGEHLRAEVEQQARQRADDILSQAQKNIEQQIAQAKSELSRQVSDLAILAAEQVIGHSMNTDDNRKLVQDFVAHASQPSQNSQNPQNPQSSQTRDLQC
jgi:F-type H+-transporting ATPase subunit b